MNFFLGLLLSNLPKQWRFQRYPGQKGSVVLIEDYAYLVLFVEKENEIFLKTIIPSRKATRKYVGDTND